MTAYNENFRGECPVCKSVIAETVIRIYDWRFKVGNHTSLLKCRNCTCQYVYPEPESIEEAYPFEYNPWYRHKSNSLFNKTAVFLKNILTGQRKYDYTKYTNKLLKSIAIEGKKNILDVGAGGGMFLDHCRKIGFNTTGLDVSDTALNELSKRGHDHFTWEELKNVDKKFDFVTLHHVLEHISDPLIKLRELRRVMAPGAYITIVVPRIDCFCFKVFGEYYNHLDGGRHVVMYSPAILAEVLIKSGFEIISCKSYSKPSNIYHSSKISSKHNNSDTLIWRTAAMILYRPLSFIITRFGRGEIIEVIATK